MICILLAMYKRNITIHSDYYILIIIIITIIGLAASMASFLLCAGSRGRRYALPHSRIMIHQPMGGIVMIEVMMIFLWIDDDVDGVVDSYGGGDVNDGGW